MKDDLHPSHCQIEGFGEILALWTAITGFDPERRSFRFKQLSLHDMGHAIRRAQELDPTDSLACLLSEIFLDDYLADASLSMKEIERDFDRCLRFIDQVREIRALYRASGVDTVKAALCAQAQRAARFYGAGDRQDVVALTKDVTALAFLWRDALEASHPSEGLRIDQFTAGDSELPAVRPRYFPFVLSSWSVGRLARAAAGMDSGIALAMIRERDAIHSYFVFVMRNGGNILTMTDRTAWEHPLQSQMRRRPDRLLSERASRSWLPYDLLDIKQELDERGEVVGLHVDPEPGLVPADELARPIAQIADLGPHELIWLTMMFDRLVERFWRRPLEPRALSYSGDMIKRSDALIATASHHNLPVAAYQPLMAPMLRAADLTYEGYVKAHGKEPDSRPRVNGWMDARYGASAPDDILNQISAQTGDRMLIAKNGGPAVHDPWNGGYENGTVAFQFLGEDAFGTREELLADRVYIARHNQAQEVHRLARLEFEAREAKIKAWWRDIVESRRDALFEALAKGSMIAIGDRRPFPKSDFGTDLSAPRNILASAPLKEIDGDIHHPLMSYGFAEQVTLGDGVKQATSFPSQRKGAPWRSYLCAWNGAKPETFHRFKAEGPGDLVAIAGLKDESEFPDVLREWRSKSARVYTGNSILSRLDPMEHITDPWSTMDFTVKVFLSRSGLKQIIRKSS